MSGLTSAATFHFHVLPQPGLLPSAFAFGFGEIASKRSEDGGERIKSEGERKTQIQFCHFRQRIPFRPGIKKAASPALAGKAAWRFLQFESGCQHREVNWQSRQVGWQMREVDRQNPKSFRR